MQNKEKQITQGIKIQTINTANKFKTNLISIFLTTKLNRKDITKKALLLSILGRGTKNLTSQEEINKKLEELYGAEINYGIDKLCDDHVIKAYIEVISEEYLYQKENIVQQSINLLCDIIFNPLTENDKFKQQYFDEEKENLKQIIESKKDNKALYAYTRCIEEMYKNTPYSLYKYGYIEDLEEITNEELYEFYKKVLKECKIDIIASGNFKEEEIEKNIEKNIKNAKLQSREIEDLYIQNEKKEKTNIKIKKEKMDVTQAKLVIGLDIIDCSKKDKPAIAIYNAILGGGANSKLFQNVREKEHLAYTVSSLYIKNKNNIIIRSGIDVEKYDKTLEIIKKQIQDMKDGKFLEKDIENAKKLVTASHKSMQDEQDSQIAYVFSKEMEQNKTRVEEYIQEIKNIQKQEIMNVANKIEINTVYMLSNK